MPRAKKRKDGRYAVSVTLRNLNGEQQRKFFYSTVSKEDARRKADEYLHGAKINPEITVEAWAEEWILRYKEGKVRENTINDTYRDIIKRYIVPAFGKIPIAFITEAQLQQFINGIATKYSDSVINKVKVNLSGIFESAHYNDVIPKNPFRYVTIPTSKKAKKEKPIYTHEEYLKIFNFAETDPNGLPIMIALELALRPEEVCGLRYEDFDLKRRTVSIERACTLVQGTSKIVDLKTKSSYRILPISSRLANRLREEPRSGYIIHSARDPKAPIYCMYYQTQGYARFFKSLQKEHPEIQKLPMYNLRHTRASILKNELGRDLLTVSRFLGHSNVVTTSKVYVHINQEDLRRDLGIE